MVDQPKPQSANELGLMRGFPPLPEQLVTHENQLYGPYNRWSFQNELKLNRTTDVWRGDGLVAQLDYAPFDIEQVSYQNRAGTHAPCLGLGQQADDRHACRAPGT